MDGGLNMKVTSEAEIQSVLALMGLGRASNTADASRSTASPQLTSISARWSGSRSAGPALQICRSNSHIKIHVQAHEAHKLHVYRGSAIPTKPDIVARLRPMVLSTSLNGYLCSVSEGC